MSVVLTIEVCAGGGASSCTQLATLTGPIRLGEVSNAAACRARAASRVVTSVSGRLGQGTATPATSTRLVICIVFRTDKHRDLSVQLWVRLLAVVLRHRMNTQVHVMLFGLLVSSRRMSLQLRETAGSLASVQNLSVDANALSLWPCARLECLRRSSQCTVFGVLWPKTSPTSHPSGLSGSQT